MIVLRRAKSKIQTRPARTLVSVPEQVSVPSAEFAFDEMDGLADARLANALRTELSRLIEMARLLM